jgi:hypothetical protein
MLLSDKDVPRTITNALHCAHALAALAMLYWWELKHLYVYLFLGN